MTDFDLNNSIAICLGLITSVENILIRQVAILQVLVQYENLSFSRKGPKSRLCFLYGSFSIELRILCFLSLKSAQTEAFPLSWPFNKLVIFAKKKLLIIYSIARPGHLNRESRMVPRKTWVSENFGRISKAFLI